MTSRHQLHEAQWQCVVSCLFHFDNPDIRIAHHSGSALPLCWSYFDHPDIPVIFTYPVSFRSRSGHFQIEEGKRSRSGHFQTEKEKRSPSGLFRTEKEKRSRSGHFRQKRKGGALPVTFSQKRKREAVPVIFGQKRGVCKPIVVATKWFGRRGRVCFFSCHQNMKNSA